MGTYESTHSLLLLLWEPHILWNVCNKTRVMVYEWYLMYRVFHNPEKAPWIHVSTLWSCTNTLISIWCMFEYALNLVLIIFLFTATCAEFMWGLIHLSDGHWFQFPVCRCRHLFLLSQGWVTVNKELQF
jgi:hypothetical protein